MTIQKVDVLGSDRLLTLEGEPLAKAFASGFPVKAAVPEGKSTAILLAVFTDRVPASLTHRVRIQVGENPEPLTVEQPSTPVRENAVRISPPLSGDKWVAANGPADSNHHTGGFMPYQGRIHVPQRFAIDFVRLQDDGKTYHDDVQDNRNYRCHGAEALAVADGLVVDVRDGIPENKPHPTERAVKMTLDTVSGNHVTLDLGGGHFAHYAHLQPGTIRVHKGDKVRRGQVLGLVGNSGNTTEPHLHFQVSDTSSILTGDGLPYAFDTFVHEGKRVRDELPRGGWVIDFDPLRSGR
jgi:murein DD-endopeptidase MepM/ murein hydrolase activator NlpD